MKQVDYSLLGDAQAYYGEECGYEYKKVPWIISEESSQQTANGKPDIFLSQPYPTVLPASGEQSFIEIMDSLEPGRYQTITPCFRLADKDEEFHDPWFMKCELLHFNGKYNDYAEAEEKVPQQVQDVIIDALSLYEQYFDPNKLSIEQLGDESYDIMVELDDGRSVELGSYGRRYATKGNRMDGTERVYVFVYGTGLAEPRFSECMRLSTTSGYHKTRIQKGELGEFGKIREEFQEMEDAVNQGNPVMALHEATDLIGAIERFACKHNISLEELIEMKNATERAFKTGHR